MSSEIERASHLTCHTMLPPVKACFISKAVSTCDNVSSEDVKRVLRNTTRVCVEENEILRAIMRVADKWHTKPIIWVGNCAYKIMLLNKNREVARLYQMNVQYDTKEKYRVVNKRLVELYF